MRMLVFGGTLFVSRAVAAEAVLRGHEVLCAARGSSGPAPDGAQLVRVDRDAADGLEPLAGESFDAVVDTSIMSHRWVSDALRVLADSAGHWTFVSSISVYADQGKRGLAVDDELLAPRPVHATLDDRDTEDPQLYGAVKVASENAVRERFGEAALIPRPGLITGHGDHTDRFGYWPARMARGGLVVVPDVPEQQFQYIDVADFAAWIVEAAEQRVGGTYNAVGRSAPLPTVLAGIAAAVGGDIELVPVAPERLTELGVSPWGGPKSLPCWLPEDYVGMCACDVESAFAAGLRVRPLADAAASALEQERILGVDRQRKAGLSVAEEIEVLAALR